MRFRLRPKGSTIYTRPANMALPPGLCLRIRRCPTDIPRLARPDGKRPLYERRNLAGEGAGCDPRRSCVGVVDRLEHGPRAQHAGALGLADNTIVVFASDHGYHNGEKGAGQDDRVRNRAVRTAGDTVSRACQQRPDLRAAGATARSVPRRGRNFVDCRRRQRARAQPLPLLADPMRRGPTRLCSMAKTGGGPIGYSIRTERWHYAERKVARGRRAVRRRRRSTRNQKPRNGSPAGRHNREMKAGSALRIRHDARKMPSRYTG